MLGTYLQAYRLAGGGGVPFTHPTLCRTSFHLSFSFSPPMRMWRETEERSGRDQLKVRSLCDKMSAISYPGNPGNQCGCLCFLKKCSHLSNAQGLSQTHSVGQIGLELQTVLCVDTACVYYHVWLWDSDSALPIPHLQSSQP